jgi:Immunoglobulin domain
MGATEPIYVTPPTTRQDNRSVFSVVVSNDSDRVTSQDALLGVRRGITIRMQPHNAKVTVGQTATFEVTATGEPPLSYQWKRNGIKIGGATGPIYVTRPTRQSDNGSVFSVVVSNDSDRVTSQDALLGVRRADAEIP